MAAIKFGTDGWRGIIAEDFTFANARTVAEAIARYVVRGEDARKGVIVGYDQRYASDTVARRVAEVFSSTGTPVWLTDKPCPTPAVSYLVREHNPYRWTGIKYKASYGSSALPSIVAQIENELHFVESANIPVLPARPELIHSLDPRKPYLDALDKLVDWERIRKSQFRFVFDAMHGWAAGLLPELFLRHGITCDEIRGTRDPRFGGAHPEPIEPHIAPLQQAVTEGKYDAGFAADGDGDRIGAVDRSGAFVNPHQIFSLLVWHLAGMRNLPGEIAKTFSVTKLIDKLAAKLGRKVHEVPIGFKYICELMGEESGGIGTSLYLPERDATVSALFLAELMAWHGKSLGELLDALHKEFGAHHYGRVDLDATAQQKAAAMAWFSDGDSGNILEWPVVGRETMDGIKLYLGSIGWVMVRASGTENLLRVYAETSEKASTRLVLQAVADRIQKT